MRAHDHTALSLCLQCHHDFHAATGPVFKGMDKAGRREWADEAIGNTRAQYLDPIARDDPSAFPTAVTNRRAKRTQRAPRESSALLKRCHDELVTTAAIVCSCREGTETEHPVVCERHELIATIAREIA